MASITYRRASLLDAPDLLRWKNDPVVIKFSIVTQSEVSEKRHAAWMDAMLADPDKRTYIIEYEGRPVGDVRLEIQHSFIEIAIKIEPRFRGMGIGRTAITAIGGLIQSEFSLPLVAKIVHGNVASMRTFQQCGYYVIGLGEGYYICSKDYTPISE